MPISVFDFDHIRINSSGHRIEPEPLIGNWIEFGGDDGGRVWIDKSTHSGKTTFGMELFDLSKSRRVQFSQYPYKLCGDIYSVSYQLYLPFDWALHVPGIDWNWTELITIFSEWNNATREYYALSVIINQPDISKPEFKLILRTKDHDGNEVKYAVHNPWELPRGRWFDVHFCVKRHPTFGKTKVWIDRTLLLDIENFQSKRAQDEFHTTIAAIYYHEDEPEPHQMWVDSDVKFYSGWVEPIYD